MLVQVGVRLVVYTDQAITRYQELDEDSSGMTNSSRVFSSEKDDEKSTAAHRRGIDNTPILCEASYILLEYARTAMFMWTFVEGLFLHSMIAATVFENQITTWIYPLIGWVLPIPLVIAWAAVTHAYYGAATCWWGYNFTWYFWILEGPRLAVLLINLGFLLSILRTLVMKLKSLNSTDTELALKAVKAALLLLPLLGITNLLNIIPAPLEKSPIYFATWSYTTHLFTSFQGFNLAFLYCFTNGEVRNTVRKFIRLRIVASSKPKVSKKISSPVAVNDN